MTTRHRIVGGRITRASKITWCPACEEFVGVWQTNFNRSDSYRGGTPPKISSHKNRDGARCPQSGYTVSPNVVFNR